MICTVHGDGKWGGGKDGRDIFFATLSLYTAGLYAGSRVVNVITTPRNYAELGSCYA